MICVGRVLMGMAGVTAVTVMVWVLWGNAVGHADADRLATFQGKVPPEFALVVDRRDPGPPPRFSVDGVTTDRVQVRDGTSVVAPFGLQFVWVSVGVDNPKPRPLDWSASSIATLGHDGDCVEVRWVPGPSAWLTPVARVVTPDGNSFADGAIPPGAEGHGDLLFACVIGRLQDQPTLRLFYGYQDGDGSVAEWHPTTLRVPLN